MPYRTSIRVRKRRRTKYNNKKHRTYRKSKVKRDRTKRHRTKRHRTKHQRYKRRTKHVRRKKYNKKQKGGMSLFSPGPVPDISLLGNQMGYITGVNNLRAAISPCIASCSAEIQNGSTKCSTSMNSAIKSANTSIKQATQTPNGQIGKNILDAAISKATGECK